MTGKVAIGMRSFETVRTRNIFYVEYGLAFEGKECLIGREEKKMKAERQQPAKK